MKAESGKILANLDLPPGRQLYTHENQTFLIYQIINPQTKQPEWKPVTREMFTQMAPFQGYPPLISLVTRGKSGKQNLMFCYVWIDYTAGVIRWRIGELTEKKSFEQITWKAYERIPGVKNKGLGSKDTVHGQAEFEGSKIWVEFLEKKGYKLLFPADEVVGNQIYFARATEPEMLTSDFDIPDAMLAWPYEAKRCNGPIIIQPKYDGKRNLYGRQKGQIITTSRGKKQNKSQYPHLKPQAEMLFFVIQEMLQEYKVNEDGKTITYNDTCSLWLDGETYSPNISFQKLMSATQSSVNQHSDSKLLDYMVYDLIDNGSTPQETRLQFLMRIFADPRVANLPNIKLSPTYKLADLSQVGQYHANFVAAGFEGLMIRLPDGLYVQKRTFSLMKVKSWITAEWYIVGAEAATGTHEGATIWILCDQADGKGRICKGDPCGPEIGTIESRRVQYQNRDRFMGAVATIKYFEVSETGIPRFPYVLAYNRTDHL